MSKNIPTTKDVEPLLEIDGDVRSFEVFLSSRTPVLTAKDIRTFLPCTVNLDPKLREIITGRSSSSEAHRVGVDRVDRVDTYRKSSHLPFWAGSCRLQMFLLPENR